MIADDHKGEGGPPPLALVLPSAWVALVMAMALHGLFGSWALTRETGLPEEVVTWLWFTLAIGVANILWGAWLLAQAWQRAPSFPGAFTLWQVFNIAAIVVSQLYIAFSTSFVPQALSVALAVGEVAIGFVLIALVRRAPVSAPAVATTGFTAPPQPVSIVVYVVNAVLGAILGGAAMLAVGLFAGSVIADVAEISCFEGGCGYFVLAIGALGLILGVVSGAVGAVMLTRRRARSRAA